MKFMLDTNAYNYLVDHNIPIDLLKGEFYTTHIPEDELNNSTNLERRKSLNQKFISLHNKVTREEILLDNGSILIKTTFENPIVPTGSFVLGYSKLGGAEIADDNLYEKLFKILEAEKPKDKGNPQDALIGDTAIKKGFVLVTNDNALRKAVGEHSPNTKGMDFSTFIEVMKNG